jgi:hypothetical protein
MSDDTLNTCDAPFGESFTEYLARQEAHQRGQALTRPKAQLEVNPRPAAAGDYTASVTQKHYGHEVWLIKKQHGGTWHNVERILKAAGIPAPFGHRDFSPIARDEATLKVHTD